VSTSTLRRPGYYFAVLRHAITVPEGATDAEARLAVASRRWTLTPRQAQVLEQISRGLSNAQIADQLGCAEATVEIHVSRVLDRAGVDSRASLLAALLWGHS
jgi:DNA-binding NarL/FixJ family response regulator